MLFLSCVFNNIIFNPKLCEWNSIRSTDACTMSWLHYRLNEHTHCHNDWQYLADMITHVQRANLKSLAAQYWQFLVKKFKQLLIILLEGMKHIWELKDSLTTAPLLISTVSNIFLLWASLTIRQNISHQN